MSWFQEKRIYLDYASATPVLREVKEAMESYWSQHFYNPSSIYREGVAVKKVVEKNRTRLARLLGIAHTGIIFTSSGTEANNLAVLGTFSESLKNLKRPHIIVSSIEHPSTMAAAEEVVRRGGELSILPVNEEGLVNPEVVRKLLRRTTVLVSVGLGNHEIGTIEPVAKIGRIVAKYRKDHGTQYPYLHTDASGSSNYLGCQLETLQADLVTIDSGKVYGPKDIALLATRPRVKLRPVIMGGEQEGGRRAGTLNPGQISAFALALEIAERDREKESKRLETLRQYFVETVTKKLPQAIINGAKDSHLPNIVSISIPGTLSEFLTLKLDRKGVLVSTGSACSLDSKVSGSPIIAALGKPELREATIRFSFGKFTTNDDVKRAAEIFCREVSNMLK